MARQLDADSDVWEGKFEWAVPGLVLACGVRGRESGVQAKVVFRVGLG